MRSIMSSKSDLTFRPCKAVLQRAVAAVASTLFYYIIFFADIASAKNPIEHPLLAAQQITNDFLADMKRSNEAESDYRNFMTPEFRNFCIKTREHVVCCALFLCLFICAYALVYRACALPQQQHSQSASSIDNSTQAQPKPRRNTRYLIVPYSSTFRSRQISLVISSAGLASACMTAILLAITVALANAMEHGDPHNLTSWRTWLLPSTLLAPGEMHSAGRHRHMNPFATAASEPGTSGPHMAHDFPPVLRRLWLYQSIISVGTAVVLLPVGILFERTSRKESSLRRLFTAVLRWASCAALALFFWEAACRRSDHLQALGFYRPFSSGGATIRYSVYHASCIFGSLPVVLLIVPRGTWALFSWIKCCVGQKHELAHLARIRCRKLKYEQSRIERLLQRAIGSWKWERIRDSDEAWVIDGFCDVTPNAASTKQSAIQNSFSRSSISDLPPIHPGLSRNTETLSSRPYRTVACRPAQMPSRPRITRDAFSPDLFGFQPKDVAVDYAPSFHRASAHPITSFSTTNMFSYYSDDTDSSDDGLGGSQMAHTARKEYKRRQLEREREMQQLSRQIRKYHAQLLFIREEMKRVDESDVLNTEDEDTESSSPTPLNASNVSRRGSLMLLIGNASSILATVTASLCWLLVVLQVSRGALSAIFVGEPDLTHNFTYFIPALASSHIEKPSLAAKFGVHESHSINNPHSLNRQLEESLDWSGSAISPLVTICQMVSSALLFVVVMFGVLSMGTSVEDSVHPLRFLAASYIGSLLRARQWEWLPYFLLPKHVLADIDPTGVIMHLLSNSQLGSVAGNTSRVFFSSSRDLTSFYREIQRQSAGAASLSTTTLLPGGILPESFLQAKAWGKRVFLIFAGGRKSKSAIGDRKGSPSNTAAAQPVSTKHLLAYVWIVCGLAMTWPSVLRTTGLISERAYILPVSSLVQPLWMQYEVDEELVLHAVEVPNRLAVDSDGSELIGSLVNAAESLDVPLLDIYGSGLCPPGYHTEDSSLLLVDDKSQLCHKQKDKLSAVLDMDFNGTTTTTTAHNLLSELLGITDNSPPSALVPLAKATATSLSIAADTEALSSTALASSLSLSQPPQVQSAIAATLERKISRKQLHQSLSTDTISRALTRWIVELTCKITSHTCISMGYIVWWISPDLIVPLSSTTVDMQLGYLPHVPASEFPVITAPASTYSEWYGMLRRLEKHNIWLPQTNDGTPLVLQRPGTLHKSNAPEAKKQQQHQKWQQQRQSAGSSSKIPEKMGWIQAAFGAVVHGLGVASRKLKALIYAVLHRVWSTSLICVQMLTDSTMGRIQNTASGAALRTVVHVISCVFSGFIYIVSFVWTMMLYPLWRHIYSAISALFSGIVFVLSLVSSFVASYLSTRSLSQAVALDQAGIANVMPPLFMSEYWDGAITLGGNPALQRLRPELWPHAFGKNAEIAQILYDAATTQPPPPQSQQSYKTEYKDNINKHGGSGDIGSDVFSADAIGIAVTVAQGAATFDKHDSTADKAEIPAHLFGTVPSSSTEDNGASAVQKEHNQQHPAAASGDDGGIRAHRIREVWSTLDWLLAIYRVVLSIIACKAVFGPSRRSSRIFVV
ncbi:hypothetical protein GGI25_003751 [Coemansia spiralis]|uniref:Transmembrane protein n=2 Tax=Coemansia TaxID=4863 RepID=A0A9W8G5U9_9FUNG|nr:hypothetical protein GGI25_003751 [Coemansia spiralis]